MMPPVVGRGLRPRRPMKDSGLKWVGQIPAGWEVNRGKYILRLLNRPVKDDDGVITCFRDGHVTLRSKRREEGFTISLKECGYQGIEPGDLVVHGMDGFAGSIGISDSRGKASPVLNVLDSTESKGYVQYYLRCMAYGDVFSALSTGIRVRSCDLRWNKLANLQYVLPPLPEQRAIAARLDELTARIESESKKIAAEIERLEQYKKSFITEAVCGRSLKPSRPMKDSDIPWVGQIPETWGVTRNKYFLRKVKEICEKWNGENVMSLTMKGVIIRDLENPSGKMPKTFDGYQFVKPGDLLMCLFDIDVTPRCIGRVNDAGVTSPAYSRFRVDKRFDANYVYYYYLMMDNSKELLHLAKNLRHAMPDEEFRKVIMPLPPLSEQNAIAAAIDATCAKVDAIVAKRKRQLDRLDALKRSLVYEYVTGKKEVA